MGTLCLYGPPGTGKTAFAHHLATSMDLPLHVRRASDLLGAFVGETEQKTHAALFRAGRPLCERRFAAKHLHGSEPATEMMPDPFDFFLSSPVVSDGVVYFGSTDGTLYAVE